MLIGLVLSAAMAGLLQTCAPNVGVQTMAGIVQYESSWQAFAIGDNDARRSYAPATREEAIETAVSLLRKGHNIDAGLAQINSSNWSAYGLDARSVFDPCANVRVGAAIITDDYRESHKQNWIGHEIKTRNDSYYQEQYALIHALSSYNSGGYWASMTYADNVYQTALSVTLERKIDPTGFVRSQTSAPPTPGTPFAQAFEPSFGER